MARDTDKAVPPPPMPQDKGRWRVAPAPDGRGMPDDHKPPPPHRLRGFWILVLVLLAINWLTLLMAQPSGPPRVKVPFSPYFLQQVQAGQVKSISSKGDTIEGKPAQTNGLASEFFFALYRETGESTYRTWAMKTLEWLDRTLYDREARLYRWSVRYEDLEHRSGQVVMKRYFNYDQGILIEANLLANQVSGERRYLERARTLGRRLDPVFWN